MTNYDIIREACIKANPSILDLKFGCEVIGANGVCTLTKRYKHTSDDLYEEVGNGSKIIQIGKILGRPIRLADVLVAIDKATKLESYFVDSAGNFHEWFAPKGRLDLRTVACWNLLTDDLRDQTEETKAFIANILK